MQQAISEFFKLHEHGTTFKRELLAGATTFFTMSYIIFVNPTIMAETGMDHGAIFVGTCLAAAIACFFMGLFANWPVALAPGMGLNAYFTYVVVGEMGYSWQTALGAVFVAGILFVIISVTPLRRWMLESIPSNLRIALGAGVGKASCGRRRRQSGATRCRFASGAGRWCRASALSYMSHMR